MTQASEQSLPEENQPVLCNTDIAELLLVNRSFVLECWPAEEYAMKNGKGKTKTKRSLLTGALVRTAATGDLAQIINSGENSKGRRILELQGVKQTSIHDIMDHPWPEDNTSKKVFEKALQEGLQSRRIIDMNIPKVATTLHRLEQAKYWSGLKQKHSNQNLASKQRSAIEGQMADCMRSTEAPPAAELLAMVQAGCEEEEPGEVSEGRRALQKHLQDIKAWQQGGPSSKVPAVAAQPTSRSAGPSSTRQHALQGQQSLAEALQQLETNIYKIKQPTPNTNNCTASSKQRRPASAPSSRTSNGSILFPAAAKHAAASSELAALQRKARQEPAAESPGIITSATISRLAPNFAAQQPAVKAKAPRALGTTSSVAVGAGKRKSTHDSQLSITSGRQPITFHLHPTPSEAPSPSAKSAPESQAPSSSGRQPITFQLHPPSSEAPSPRPNSAHESQPLTSSERQPITFQLHPTPSEAPSPSPHSAHESQPPTSSERRPITFHLPPLPSEAPAPSAISPTDQSTAGKRKKIKWDPEAALAQQTLESQAQKPALLHSLDSPILRAALADVPSTTDAPSATGRRLDIKMPPSFNPTLSSGQTPAGCVKLPQNFHQHDQRQQHQARVERSARREQEPAGLKANLAWSWGQGAAVGGQFAAALVNISAAELASGALAKDAQLPFSHILHPEQQQQLASTTCTVVSLVQCEGQSSNGRPKPVPLAVEALNLSRGTLIGPAGSSFDAVKGRLEHGRLWGILEASGAALALCTSSTVMDAPGDHHSSLQANAVFPSDDAAANKQQHSDEPSAGKPYSNQRQVEVPVVCWAETESASNAGMPHLLASLGVSRSKAPPAKGSATQWPAAAAAQSKSPGSSQQMPVISAMSKAADLPSHLAILLVAAGHLRPWLSATGTSKELVESVLASCAAHSPAIYALTLHTSDPPLTPIQTPSIAPEQPFGSPTKSQLSQPLSESALPHQVSSSSSIPSWFVPVSTIVNSLRPPANKETEARTNSKASSGVFSSVSADNELRVPSLPLPASVPGIPDATTPVVNPHEQRPASQQQHPHQHTSQQRGHPDPVLPSKSTDLPLASVSASVPQHGVSQSATERTLNSAAAAANREATAANASGTMKLQGSKAAEEELSSGMVKAKQLEPVGQSQLQQQADTSSKKLLQQSALGSQHLDLGSSDMSISPQPGVPDQPPSSDGEAAHVSPATQHPTDATNSMLQKLGQPAAADLGKSLPEIATPTPSLDLNPARSDDATAASSLDVLKAGSAEGQLQHMATAGEPPSRGKRSEHEEPLTLDPAAAQLMSGKPKLQGAVSNSPLDPSSAAASLRTGKFGAAGPSTGQPAAKRPSHPGALSPAITDEASAAAAASHLTVEAQAREGSASGKPATSPSPPAAQASAPSRPKQKRNYRQSTAEAEASPEAKRLKHAPAQAQVKQEPQPSELQQQQQYDQQQQRQQAQSSTAKTESHKAREPIRHPEQSSRHPEQPIDLPTSVVQNIFRSIRKLRLQGFGQNGQQQLSSHHMDLMTHLPPLVQLRVLSKYATEVLPHGNVVKFFSLTVETMGRKSQNPWWLTQRDETATTYRLCDAAVSLYGRLGDCGLLPEGIVPVRTPQLVPLELQAAYVLCVGGHTGGTSQKEFADKLMIALLAQVCLMMRELKASSEACETAKTNLLAAGGSSAQVFERSGQLGPSRSTAQHGSRAAESCQLTVSGVQKATFDGMICLNRLKADACDDRSMNFLTAQDALWQLRILSQFAGGLISLHKNASAFLTSVCRNNRNDSFENKLDWLREFAVPPNNPKAPLKLHREAQTVLNQAYRAGMIPKVRYISAIVGVLPRDLHCVAASYVIGVQSSEPSSNRATSSAESFVRFAQGLIHDVDPAAVPSYTGVGPEAAARPASQPLGDCKSDRAELRRSNEHSAATAAQTGNPNLIPLDPRRQHPSQPSHPQTSAAGHQGNAMQPLRGARQDQSHAPPLAMHPQHCKYYYRINGGCSNGKCTYYHGSHEEYVAYMIQRGLIPYSLKFVSDVGRDKWIIDGAVDALNDMIISHRLPRGSLGEYDLRPLAFLQDPRGDHAQMQLQVVQRMAQHGPTSDAVELLQRTCHQVQAEAQPGSGGHPAMSEGYGSRGMMPMPEDSFAGPSSSLPQPSFANAHMFSGPANFGPSSSAMPPLPLSLPFAPDLLTSEDQPDGDIPFPVLRYEEELLAGLILFQHEGGAVSSVDHLLALQPQCAMPTELARHFHGDMRDRVLSFLQTRPWLFGVDPHGGISVTRLAREGLIYKRDVITYLYNAFIDNAPHVALAEINDRVPQPPGMQQVMMENNGLLGLMDTQLFRDDVMLQPGPFGPQDIRVVLQSSGV